MKKIIDRTPIYAGYRINETGYAEIPKATKGAAEHIGCLCFYEKFAIDYGYGVWGLFDSKMLSPEDFTALHRGFYIIYNDGTNKFHNVVSASEGSVVDGNNPWMTADYLARRKRGEVVEHHTVETEFKFGCGHAIEEMILNGFYELESRKYKNKKFVVFTDHSIFFDTNSGYLMANVDAFAETDEGNYIVEAKSTTNTSGWTDKDVPEYYKTQAIKHYPLVLGKVYNIIGTYFVGMFEFNLNSLMIRKYDRLQLLENLYLDKVKKFIGFLESGEPIPYGEFEDAANAVADEITQKYPLATDKNVVAIKDEKIISAIASYLDIHKRKSAIDKLSRELENEEKPFKNEIRNFLGNRAKASAVIDGVEYQIDASNNAPSYSMTSKNTKALKDEDSEIFEKLVESNYVTCSQTRKFSIKEKKEPKSKKLQKKESGASE